jgi:hypothetical protein
MFVPLHHSLMAYDSGILHLVPQQTDPIRTYASPAIPNGGLYGGQQQAMNMPDTRGLVYAPI